MGVWDTIKKTAGTAVGYVAGGPVGALAGTFGSKIIGGTKDAFTADTVTAAQTKPSDYQYGGDESVRDAELQKLSQRGEYAYGTLAGTGARNYDDTVAGANSIGLASNAALGSGTKSAANAGMLSRTALDAYGNTPTIFGDQRALTQWGQATNALAGYSPSTQSQGTAAKLDKFNAGGVNPFLNESYGTLSNYAKQGPGPSAAEAQLNQALDANVANQIALARSGRGAGANANAERQAMFQAADLGQRTAGEAATLRANEAATWRNQQLQAINAAGGIAGNIESAEQARSGLGLQALTANAQLAQASDAQRLQAQQAAVGQYGSIFGAGADAQQAASASRQGYLTQAMSGQQASAAQQAAAYQTYLGGLGTSASLYQGAGQDNLAAQQAGLSALSAYDQQAIALREAENQRRATLAMANAGQTNSAAIANQGADSAQDARTVGLFSGLLEAGVKAGGAK